MSVVLRPITEGDQPFLYQVYASTRKEDLSVLDWSQSQKDAFLAMQFRAQHTFYQEQFAEASFQVILCDGERIGPAVSRPARGRDSDY